MTDTDIKDTGLLSSKIERYLESLLTNGSLKVGDKLLPEQAIGRLFNASNRPVRQAMQKFIDRGVLEKTRGKGTFVKRLPGREKQTDRLAVLYCHSRAGLFSSSFYMSIVSGIESQMQVERKTMVLRSLIRDGEEQAAAALDEIGTEVDGILLLDPPSDMFAAVEGQLINYPVPAVVVNTERVPDKLDAVVPDSHADIRRVMDFLLGLGHTRISFALAASWREGLVSGNFLNRKYAWQQSLQEAGIDPAGIPALKFCHDKDPDDGTIADPSTLNLYHHNEEDLRLFDMTFTGPHRPTAVVCAGDHIALYVYKLAHRAGLRIPDDLSVVGYDDIMEAQLVRPALTTIRTPLQDMGARAVQRLLEKIRERQAGIRSHYRITMPGTLVERASHRSLTPEN